MEQEQIQLRAMTARRFLSGVVTMIASADCGTPGTGAPGAQKLSPGMGAPTLSPNMSAPKLAQGMDAPRPGSQRLGHHEQQPCALRMASVLQQHGAPGLPGLGWLTCACGCCQGCSNTQADFGLKYLQGVQGRWYCYCRL